MNIDWTFRMGQLYDGAAMVMEKGAPGEKQRGLQGFSGGSDEGKWTCEECHPGGDWGEKVYDVVLE